MPQKLQLVQALQSKDIRSTYNISLNASLMVKMGVNLNALKAYGLFAPDTFDNRLAVTTVTSFSHQRETRLTDRFEA